MIPGRRKTCDRKGSASSNPKAEQDEYELPKSCIMRLASHSFEHMCLGQRWLMHVNYQLVPHVTHQQYASR